MSVLFKLGSTSVPRKSFLIGSCVILGVATCFTLRYYWKRRSRKYYSSVEETCADGGKRILVLGLDDAGKSSLLLHLSRPDAASTNPLPTEGFNVVCINSENGSSLNFWELGGSEAVRPYWPNFLHDTSVLVYMVNSADIQRLRSAAHEFRRILQDERLKDVPILVLANKQDLPGAKPVEDISATLGLDELKQLNFNVHILPLQMPSDASCQSTVAEAKRGILQLLHGCSPTLSL
uniref:Putative gtp-binding adp-ribosylation factor arf1 n=1 Tax=Amblyomma triste TaxID=251400 RepID=A0A023G6C0_AMBTT